MKLHGYLIMVASCVFYSAAGAALRALSGKSHFVVAFWRFGIGAVLILVPWGLHLLRVRFVRKDLLALRGVTGAISISMHIAAVIKIGLAKATFLTYTYPAWAAVLSVFLLGERPRVLVWVALGGSMLGSYLMLMDPSLPGVHTYEVVALIGAIFSAIAICSVRKLRETDSPPAIFLSLCLFGAVLLAGPANWQPYVLSARDFGLIVATGVAAMVGQVLMTYAYKEVAASEGSLIGLLTPVFNLLIAGLVFRETLTPSSALGAGLIFACCVGVMLQTATPLLGPRG